MVETDSRGASARFFWIRLRDTVAYLALTVAALVALTSVIGIPHWMLDNLTSFTAQLFAGLVALVAALLWLRKWRSAALGAAIAATFATLLYPQLHSRGAGDIVGAPNARWLVANVLTSNRNHDALIELIRDSNPDVIGLVEAGRDWVRALDAPLGGYPYRVLVPREDNFGMALYSRIPLKNAQVRDLGVVPTITASIELKGREVDLVLVHVVPPVSAYVTTERNEHLARLAELRPRQSQGLVLAGDFNVTPYSPTYRSTFDASTFKRAGGIAGTFPAVFPSPLRIPIDHALSAGAVAVKQTIGPAIGSDHLPLLIEIFTAAGPDPSSDHK